MDSVVNVKERFMELDDLPALPGVALKILERIRDPESSMQQLAEILATDPTLSAKVLMAVNSPYFGLQRSITNLPHAVNLLGEDALKYIALSFLIRIRNFLIIQHFGKEKPLHLSGVQGLLQEYGLESSIHLETLLPQVQEQIEPLKTLFDLGLSSELDFLKILEDSKRELMKTDSRSWTSCGAGYPGSPSAMRD
jgi:hypothetical protein